MVSSTFSDLEEHRREVKTTIEGLGFHANVMETSGPRADADVIEDSIGMVGASAAFIGVISHRYGQTPKCPDNNPDELSISELEFNEAMRLGRPILLFIMGDDHPITVADVETDPKKKKKLDAFRKRAKKMRAGSEVERIYEVFNSREEFTKTSAIAIGNLSKALPPDNADYDKSNEPEERTDSIETALPPELRAVPRYLGSHDFVGRAAELDALDDWCAAADPNPMLLFEAIGGSGKSMVTWTWLMGRATQARDDWAGRFWFSFYEGGATMTSFCREALAYITKQPVKSFHKQKTRTLMPKLLAELEAQPWLIVLDGLERILVAYHRIDAPQMRDEDVDTAEDQISNRDPRAAINPEDEELLRLLTDSAPSKILVTSRLTPQALMNRSDMPMPGVRREMLQGLRPADAEALLRSCGVSGDSKAIQQYLQHNCDCHPLVIGALAGLINNYKPDPGNFNAWLADPAAGGKLGLADLDLTQRRNHILDAAIDALPEAARKILQTLSLLQGGADYTTLSAFNPHLPPQPKEVKKPLLPEENWRRRRMNDKEKAAAKTTYKKAKKTYGDYVDALKEWEQSPEVTAAPAQLDKTLNELERRGLLQYDHGLKRYDLHPVVRGVASGRMGETETGEIGAQVVDHFSSRQHDPYEQAECLEELATGIQIVTTLTRMGEFNRALIALQGELTHALHYNLMAYGEIVRLIRPFFPNGWDGLMTVSQLLQHELITIAGNALSRNDEATAQRLYERNLWDSSKTSDEYTQTDLHNLISSLERQNKLSTAERLSVLNLKIAEASGNRERIFSALRAVYLIEFKKGMFERADVLWTRLDSMGRNWSRNVYRMGNAEEMRACDLFFRGALTEAVLIEAEGLCRKGSNREGVCYILSLHGEWRLSRGEPDLAIDPLNEALRLYREAGGEDSETEALLALAQLRTGRKVDAGAIGERLDRENEHETALAVAELWRELGEPERAVAAALRAHKSACGSGEPYVFRYHLNRAEALLRELGETPPEVPQHDPADDEVFDWEDDIRALIEKTRKEREERERQEAENEENTSEEN